MRHAKVVFGVDRLWEGYPESRRCSRDTYPESYITKYTSIRRLWFRPRSFGGQGTRNCMIEWGRQRQDICPRSQLFRLRGSHREPACHAANLAFCFSGR